MLIVQLITELLTNSAFVVTTGDDLAESQFEHDNGSMSHIVNDGSAFGEFRKFDTERQRQRLYHRYLAERPGEADRLRTRLLDDPRRSNAVPT